jgi:hypothetical protein
MGGSDVVYLRDFGRAFLTATGIYDPPDMRHGRCVAEPGSFDALYCPGQEAPVQRRHRKR